ncbi:ketoacyl-synt-domain-containing protein [Melanomma pulvis-pyrius CBS 109.77]|uniref:Ketoacyl-synt-domain-containing protein n=1 Tax=Melanomma pulvis-pyrius CBS 109.77 TaxID=1314802 RepID=A0A6A6XGD0_9PLEO|nr:ketoacyl-synt-domain-containing protein [Melanomma pulvis-pyrius CBS 109.77]
MAIPMQVFVFGDQTYDVCDLLSNLMHAHDDVVLSAFLEASCQTLKQEVARLRSEQRIACPRFSKLAELLSLWQEGDLNPCLSQALSCICHIGTFLHLSAPPDVLRQLISETTLSGATVVQLPITAPYHAEHLYTEDDVDSILFDAGHCTSAVIIPIISSSTGAIIRSTTFRDAIRISVKACLQQTIRWDLVVAGVAFYIQDTTEDEQFVIRHIAIAPDALGTAVQDALGHSSRRTHLSIEPQTATFPDLHPSPKSKSKIAILSMAGRFPRAPSMEAFWDVLKNGIDTHEMAPPSRWDTRTHNTSGTGFGCWLHDAAQFDARFFNMSPREAPQVDPAQRIALLTAAEALEQAGIVPGRTTSSQKDRVGVYFGCTSNDWMETNSAQNIDTYFIPGGNRAFIPGRINYHFKFSGPSYTIDTASCNALWNGEIDTAVVGGTNVLTNPDMTAGLDRGHFLSRTGNCKTFDETADGYCRGEAVATAVLKRLDDAITDKDPIQACILAISTNHSAEADSITRPHVGAQQALFRSLLADAGVNPPTQAGDASETLSVLQALAPDLPSRAARTPSERLYIGAAKSNVGHGEAAAGVTSLAKVLLMLKHSSIPPHCGIKTKVNHKLPDLGSRNTAIATRPLYWPRPAQGKRQILLNNFSAAGGNTALVLEDAPDVPVVDIPDTRRHHVVARNLTNLVEWIDAQDDPGNLTLARLSYTTTARRIHHPHRVMIIASDLKSVKKSLQESLDHSEGNLRPKGIPRYIFAFTGQGSQFAGMGADLYSRLSGFRADIHRYEQICGQLQLPSIEQLFKEPDRAFVEATPTMLQLASVCFQMALYRMWVSFGIVPSAVVGHSLGEYAALYAASVLSQADVISLVGRRAQLLDNYCEQGSHTMLAVRSNANELETLLGPPGATYELSCLNGRDNVVLGGTRAQMDTLRPTLGRSGLSNTLLNVPYAYHTSQVDPILASLQSIANGVRFAKPALPIISPTYGKVLTQRDDFGPDFVVRHCRAKVDMLGALNAAKDMHFIEEKMMGLEIGPAPVVIKMVKEMIGPSFQTFASSRHGKDTYRLLAPALSAFYTAGADIDWMAYHADFLSSHVVLELPAYGWDMKEYWIQYVHDWSLRKGDPPLRAELINLESSSIHNIRQDTLSVSGGQLIVEADLSRPDLHPMVQGHKVYGVPLCTPSVYADIALTIGEYAKRFLEAGSGAFAVEVANMIIQSALVANSDGNLHVLRTVARLDCETKSISCTFSSIDNNGKLIEQHANCLLRLFNVDEARNALGASAPYTKSRISSLKEKSRNFCNTFRYSKAMIYKMVGQLADFDSNYRALEEITLDSDAYEATGSVNFTKVLNEGTFHTNPAYIDALSQLGGFVMNANEAVDLDKELFVNHGWGSLRLFEKLDSSKIYTTHVKMAEGKDKLWSGDITIMNEDIVVGIFSEVALQGVPKRLMQYIVNSANRRTFSLTSGNLNAKVGQRGHPVEAVNTIMKTTTKKSIVDQQLTETKASITAINIISQESGIDIADLTDDTRFDDIGVDSLLSLMVSSRIRDELGIDFESSIFFDLQTVGHFKTSLKGLGDNVEKITTVTETVQEEIAPINVTMPHPNEGKNIVDIWPKALNILAEESGINRVSLTDDTRFSDIGVDSLLSLVVCSRMRDELQLEIPDQSLFLDFPTVESLRDHITGGLPPLGIGYELSDPDVSTTSSDSASSTPVKTPSIEAEVASMGVPVLPDSKGPTLVKPAWDPHEMMSRPLSEVLASYVEGVRIHQSHGPYHLGGWSAGGILAYAAAQEFIAAGEEVATLILIDSPPPNNGLDRLPRRFFDHCSKVGIFGKEMNAIGSQDDTTPNHLKLPTWLMPHFEATIELLHDYHAPPMPLNSNGPRKVSIIWAEACAFSDQYDPLPPASSEAEDTEGMKFLTEEKTDLGPGKWAELFPGRNITVDVVRGHHHFSMMRGPGGEQLGRFIRKALGLIA